MNAERDEFQDLLSEIRSSADYRLEGLVQAFSDELWAAMNTRGMTKAELARRAGVNRQFLTQIFKGKPNLTIKTMAKLAEAIGHHVCVHLAPQEVECEWFHFEGVEVSVAVPETQDGVFGEPVSFHGFVSNLAASTYDENFRHAA